MGETFVGLVLNNIMALFPFVIVRTYQRGVRWVLGRNPRELLPGFHWKFWFFHQIDVLDVAAEAVELPIQSIITADEKLVCFSVNICFRVINIVDHVCNVQDFHESTKALAMTHLARRVREEKLVDLIADLKKLEKSLEGTLTTRFKDWGTEVFSVGFTNFAEVPRQIRLFTNSENSLVNGHK